MSVRDKHTEYSRMVFSLVHVGNVRFWYPQSKYLRSYSIIYTRSLTHSQQLTPNNISTLKMQGHTQVALHVLTFTSSRYFRLNVNFFPFIIDLRKTWPMVSVRSNFCRYNTQNISQSKGKKSTEKKNIDTQLHETTK